MIVDDVLLYGNSQEDPSLFQNSPGNPHYNIGKIEIIYV